MLLIIIGLMFVGQGLRANDDVDQALNSIDALRTSLRRSQLYQSTFWPELLRTINGAQLGTENVFLPWGTQEAIRPYILQYLSDHNLVQSHGASAFVQSLGVLRYAAPSASERDAYASFRQVISHWLQPGSYPQHWDVTEIQFARVGLFTHFSQAPLSDLESMRVVAQGLSDSDPLIRQLAWETVSYRLQSQTGPIPEALRAIFQQGITQALQSGQVTQAKLPPIVTAQFDVSATATQPPPRRRFAWLRVTCGTVLRLLRIRR